MAPSANLLGGGQTSLYRLLSALDVTVGSVSETLDNYIMQCKAVKKCRTGNMRGAAPKVSQIPVCTRRIKYQFIIFFSCNFDVEVYKFTMTADNRMDGDEEN